MVGDEDAWPIIWGQVKNARRPHAMTEAWGTLHINVVDDEIIVTLPFTIYT